MWTPGAIACSVVYRQHKSASLCVYTSTHICTLGAEFAHACTQVWVHRSTRLLCRHVQAGAWLILGIARLPHPSAESARGQVGPGGPGNLSQLLCPVSGKPPAGILPTEPACPYICPLGFQEGPKRPTPQPCTPESTTQTRTMQGVCNLLPPTPSEPLTMGTRRASGRAECARGVN